MRELSGWYGKSRKTATELSSGDLRSEKQNHNAFGCLIRQLCQNIIGSGKQTAATLSFGIGLDDIMFFFSDWQW